ncbi:hypothetical protein [Bdellovibrio sp. HCB337]|uniref:hypothetical protein n=1 Tax=Bdellovibrio sp. HCB337 TaxID=3394358 RepID=UPI0039A4166E
MKALIVLLLTSSVSQALNLNQLQGGSRQQYRSPNGLTEVCIIPKRWPSAYYRDSDREKEAELCGYDFYSNVGICPKYNSTNPAILLLKPNNEYSKQAIDASSCNVDKMSVSTEAKFKQSISCSHTPSILAYYQISRILGDAGRVPVAVVRSMDRKVHSQLTQKANKALSGSSDTIAKTWEQFSRVHRHPDDYPDIVDASESQIYGALSDNIKNEEKYTDVSGKGSYDSRYTRFLSQPPFQRVSSSASVRELVGSSEFSKVAQTVTQMKDVGDMIVLDTLLNQQDRIGNIHYRFYWYSLNPQKPGKIERTKSKAKWKDSRLIVPPEETKAMSGRTAVLIKEMLLRDNDCGVNKSNMMRAISALEKVRHVSYLTYYQLLNFEKSLASSSAKDYFTSELLFSSSEFKSLRENAAKAKDILKSNCRAGRLKFDVDLADYMPGASIPQRSCEI